MNAAKFLFSTIALVTAAVSPAAAEWRWIEDDPPARTETHVYEERRIEEPEYYRQEPRTYYREEAPTYYRRETYVAPVVTDREIFRDGRCQVTRTYMSDGSTSDDRVCNRLMLPHEFIIDRLGRHFDHLRGY